MIYLSIGRRELGKTTLSFSMAKRASRSVALDPRFLLPDAADEPIGDLTIETERDRLWRRIETGPYPIVVQPSDDLIGTSEELAKFVRDYTTIFPQEQLAVVLDEASLLDLNTRRWQWVTRCSPRDRIDVIVTAHRPRDIHTNVRALADVWCIFRITQQHDLDVIADRCAEHVADRVARLKPREFVMWDDARGEAVEYLDPRVWYTPLARPIGITDRRDMFSEPGTPIETPRIARRVGLFDTE